MILVVIWSLLFQKHPFFKPALNPIKSYETRLNARFFWFWHLVKMCFSAFKSRLSHHQAEPGRVSRSGFSFFFCFLFSRLGLDILFVA